MRMEGKKTTPRAAAGQMRLRRHGHSVAEPRRAGLVVPSGDLVSTLVMLQSGPD